ncbi:deoxyribodipyrimidine photo-lyase [Baekduia soli]|uniref:Deoxyribodipyrimidine photo-lyase n=1 Tax=Baekduia soli TaxID=496014 RepID=A0A5B8U3W1_9ACTN|nr:deoxyribodipyrimidine photo-lyase [Baekduia soli]QEC47690.1 deoxyribodipyrimidine photo-lyase [Baekduia soli]
MADRSVAVLWFRRDLRVHDHPALVQALDEHDRIVPLYVLDDALLGGRYASPSRTAFMLGCLRALDQELAQRGSGLVVRHGRPEDEVPALARELGAEAVHWTSDVSPYARRRDTRVSDLLREHEVRPRPHGGTYLVDPSKPRTQGGRPYTVFSPFHRAIDQVDRRTVHRAPAELPPLPSGLRKGRLPSAQALGIDPADLVPEPVAEPGEPAARAALERWLRDDLDHYADRHDGMSRPGTSVLSPYLRWGCLSARECEERAARRGGKGAAAWNRQLAWRDFYAHQLLLFPDNVAQEFQPRYRRRLAWSDDEELLRAWKDGRTGYPLVDAGMRQLARTGWMHNRARLVVGSFLTKDLHIDWRQGERHFARLLLDGEPAQNNGNWQWIASTGADPAPYFRRLFNPMTQQRKFDPEGTYVRRWVPELAGVPDERLVEPWTMSDEQQQAAGCVIGTDYPAPIVDHAQERRVAMERYAAAGEG